MMFARLTPGTPEVNPSHKTPLVTGSSLINWRDTSTSLHVNLDAASGVSREQGAVTTFRNAFHQKDFRRRCQCEISLRE